MTIPTSVAALQLFAAVQAAYFVAVWLRKSRHTSPPDVSASARVSSKTLLYYRLAMLTYALYIGVLQAIRRGRRAFMFYTVWNWWLLTTYFALAALASWLAIKRKGKGGAKPAGLHWIVTIIFHTEASTLIVVDTITWLVLVPMLMADPDPERRAIWVSRMFCLESYSQHGLNALMLGGDLVLGQLRPDFWAAGWPGVWAGAYGVWSAIFFLIHGRPIYPFMDLKQPHAWVGFVFMIALGWAGFGLVQGALHWSRRAEAKRDVTSRKVTTHNEAAQPLLGAGPEERPGQTARSQVGQAAISM